MAEHYATADDAWLKIAKKGSGVVSVTAVQALEVAVCYGWIDSQRKACDEQCFLQFFILSRIAVSPQ